MTLHPGEEVAAPRVPVPRTHPALAPAALRRRPDYAGYAGLVVAGVIMVVPLLWMLLASLKQRDEIYTIPVRWLPSGAHLQNYAEAIQTVPFLHFLLNSLITTVLGAGLKVLLGLTCAYALVFVEFPGKRLVFVVVLAALMVPQQVTLIPNYTLIAQLGWLNTYQGIVVPGLASAFGTFLFRQHFRTFPLAVLEAATLDGAGHWRRLWQFVVPLSAPTVAAVTLVSVVTEWNDYLWPLLVVDHADMMTLPVGLTLLQNNDGLTNWGVLMAGTVLVIVPILLVFLFFQRRSSPAWPPAPSPADAFTPRQEIPIVRTAPVTNPSLVLPRRGVLGLAGLGAAGLGLAACSGPSTTARSGSSPTPTTDFSGVKPASSITFWTNHPGKSQAVEQELITRFNAEHPEIAVNLVTAGASYDEISQKFQAALSGDDLPDVVLLSDVWWFRYMLNGQLAPLGPVMEAVGIDGSEYQDTLFGDYTYAQQQWALPYCRSTPVFYYNKAHWSAAGLPDRGPETWSEFDEWMPRLAAAGTGAQVPYGLGKGTGNASWIFQNLVWGNGGAYSDEWTMTVDSAEVLTSSDYLRGLVTKDLAAVSSSDQAADFGSGLYSSVIGSTGSLTGILAAAEFPVGNAFLPAGPSGLGVPTGGAGLAVPKKRSPEQQLAAATFVKFMGEDESTSYFSQNTGYMPVTKAAVASDTMQQVYAKTPLFKTAVDQLEQTRSQDWARVFMPGGDQSTVTAWESVLLQGADSKTAWGTAQAEIQKSYSTDVEPLV